MYDLERELAAINNEIKNIAAQGDVVEVYEEETLETQVKILNFLRISSIFLKFLEGSSRIKGKKCDFGEEKQGN